jgi:SAM-dependent methyltransferase
MSPVASGLGGHGPPGGALETLASIACIVGRSMPKYMLPQEGVEDFERGRLARLEEVCDPLTRRQFDAIDVREGWRCLDVGAGGGSATRLLAERIGDTGSVLAVDIDTRLLAPLASERVEVRRHDLLADPLPDRAFDLVHARNLLMHLPARVDALRRLLAAVRPGGWLALHEPDFNAVRLTPADRSWRRAWSAFCDATVAGGWDPGYGARLVSDIEGLDLGERHADVVVQSSPGGGVRARLFADTLERFRERMLELGATVEDLDAAQCLLRDPRVTFRAPAFTTAWARRAD